METIYKDNSVKVQVDVDEVVKVETGRLETKSIRITVEKSK